MSLSIEPDDAIRRNDTQWLVDEKKAEMQAEAAPCWLLVAMALSTILTSSVYLYIGFNVEPVNTCGAVSSNDFDGSSDSWKTWYRVEGFLTIAQGFCTFAMLQGAQHLYQDKILRALVYSEQGRDEEATAVAMEMYASERSDAKIAALSLCCSSCFNVILLMVDFGWLIWGWVLYFQTNDTCTLMTKLFLYLAIYTCAVSILVYVCKSCFRPPPPPDDEDDESEASE